MNSQNKTILIPKFLWKLHGKQAYKIDLALTYLLAVLVMFFSVLNVLELELWKIIVVAVLSVDIGGGVVSNFTKGTIDYYKESSLSPHFFVWFHTLQACALAIIYKDFLVPVAIIMFAAMLGASITAALRKTVFHLQTSVFLFSGVVLLMSFYPQLPVPLNTLIILMAFKLIVGFAGHYKK